METAVKTFELRPTIKTTLKRDMPNLSVKQGEEVTLTRATVDGSRARFGSNQIYPEISDYNLSDKDKLELKVQAQAATRELASGISFSVDPTLFPQRPSASTDSR